MAMVRLTGGREEGGYVCCETAADNILKQYKAEEAGREGDRGGEAQAWLEIEKAGKSRRLDGRVDKVVERIQDADGSGCGGGEAEGMWRRRGEPRWLARAWDRDYVVVVPREKEGGEKEDVIFFGRDKEAGLVRGGKGAFFSASLVAGSVSRV